MLNKAVIFAWLTTLCLSQCTKEDEYFVSIDPKSITDASQFCTIWGGSLTSITSTLPTNLEKNIEYWTTLTKNFGGLPLTSCGTVTKNLAVKYYDCADLKYFICVKSCSSKILVPVATVIFLAFLVCCFTCVGGKYWGVRKSACWRFSWGAEGWEFTRIKERNDPVIPLAHKAQIDTEKDISEEEKKED